MFGNIFKPSQSPHHKKTLPVGAQLHQAKAGVEMEMRFKTRRVPKSGTVMEDTGLPGHNAVPRETFMIVGHCMGEQLPWSCLEADQTFIPEQLVLISLVVQWLILPTVLGACRITSEENYLLV